MSKENFTQDFVFKIVVIGDGAVGKTSLIKRYTEGSFDKQYIKTLGAQFSRYEQVFGEKDKVRCRLFFWDIAGQKEFSFMRPTFYNGAKAVIVVYDLSRPETFKSIMEWHSDITKYCGVLPTIIFGNKVDLIDEDTHDSSALDSLVEKQKFIGSYLTSAKTGLHVHDAFNTLIDNLVQKAQDS